MKEQKQNENPRRNPHNIFHSPTLFMCIMLCVLRLAVSSTSGKIGRDVRIVFSFPLRPTINVQMWKTNERDTNLKPGKWG